MIVDRTHPHKLVGDNCKNGLCLVEIRSDSPSVTFRNIGLQCVKKKEIEQVLKFRQENRVDPKGCEY